ncbi:hypothetical protein AC579_6015 [Pseudocercospora musae]|uniref:Uncharacterized protein n=1 Tax=Pseudocercospora musae TaxID=113226 RepID=A0A139HRT4_9PEZI|nr:hypothetical protein AC579_6015 [Pseudocercospora musae]
MAPKTYFLCLSTSPGFRDVSQYERDLHEDNAATDGPACSRDGVTQDGFVNARNDVRADEVTSVVGHGIVLSRFRCVERVHWLGKLMGGILEELLAARNRREYFPLKSVLHHYTRETQPFKEAFKTYSAAAQFEDLSYQLCGLSKEKGAGHFN